MLHRDGFSQKYSAKQPTDLNGIAMNLILSLLLLRKHVKICIRLK